MYLITEYVFRESVDSEHNSQISSTLQEADCLLKLVKINKQVFAITLLSRNLNHTAQLSISARGEIIILSVGLGGGGRNGEDPRKFMLKVTYIPLPLQTVLFYGSFPLSLPPPALLKKFLSQPPPPN